MIPGHCRGPSAADLDANTEFRLSERFGALLSEGDECGARAGLPAALPVCPAPRDREFFNHYTGTRPGGVPDLEVRQARAKERRAKEAKVVAAKTSRPTRARKAATKQGGARKT